MANESIKAGFQRLWEHTINKIEERVKKEDGKGLSTNDFTDEYKNKIDIQPDWNQNDENDPAYVKNRTHWSEEVITEIIPETQVTLTEDDYEGAIETTVTFVKDHTYIVTWNGVEYTCIGQEITTEGTTITGIGDLSIMGLPGVVGVGNGEPFVIMTSAALLGANVMAVVGLVEGVYDVTVSMKTIVKDAHKLPMEYLPEGYPYVEGEENVLVEYNGVIGQDTVGSFMFQYFTENHLVNGEKYTVFFEGVKYPDVVANVSEDTDSVISFGVAADDGIKSLVVSSFLNAGFIMCTIYDSSITTDKDDYTTSIKVVHGKEVIHRIDHRYLPEGYPYVESGTIDILPETTFTFADASEPFAQITQTMDLTVGNTYKVTFAGVEYVAKAQLYEEDGQSAIILGNFGLLSGTGDTGEPFIILYSPEIYSAQGFNGMLVDLSESGATEIKIAISYDGEVIHKMDSKYIDLDWIPSSEKGTIIIESQDIKHGKEVTGIGVSALTVGQQVAVLYDGTRYDTTVGLYETIKIIGDPLSIINGTIGSVPFGFVIASSGESILVMYSDSGTHTICIFDPNGEDTTIYNKLPINYLPDHTHSASDVEFINKNIVDGSAEGSLRVITSSKENDSYSIGKYAFAEGSSTKASGAGSHAEGANTTASGMCSHAEGYADSIVNIKLTGEANSRLFKLESSIETGFGIGNII